MSHVNQVVISGYLGHDAELRYTPHGLAIMSFRLASTQHWKKDGKFEQKTTWIGVKLFGAAGERLTPDLKKGSYVLVTGRLEESSWIDRTSQQKRSKIEIIAQQVRNLSRRSNDEDQAELPFRDEVGKQLDEQTDDASYQDFPSEERTRGSSIENAF